MEEEKRGGRGEEVMRVVGQQEEGGAMLSLYHISHNL